jgi:acetyl coenzyme A synthetase (ADP forming)-like protein
MVATVPREDVVLQDGSTLRLRSTADDDSAALVEFFDHLSPGSLFMRFHGTVSVRPRLVAPFLVSDGTESLSLVGERDGSVVALGTYIRLRDPSRAEVAFAVADDMQRKGVGSRLLERLAVHARAEGIERFVALVLPQNTAMLRVFGDTGFEVSRRLVDGVYEVEFELTASPEVLERIAARDHSAVTASLQPFFKPSTVAVIGASARRGSIGGELFRNVIAGDFAGAAYPVNPKGDAVGGVQGYASIADVPAEVDLAVICVPGELVLDAARAALRAGIRALCVISAGFAETGAEGAERQDELLTLVRGHGARLIGPNCLGVASNAVSLNATFARRAFPPGRIAFSSQSGALGLALLEQADARGLGVSAFVSIGNKADVSSNDLLEYWGDDPDSDLVLLYLESFGNPRTFARVAGRVARSKPILAMRSGTSQAGARAAASHTAALAGSDAVVDALFREAGVLRARSLEELLDTAAVLTALPAPAGNRVAVVTNAGGLGILCADACEAAGLVLPRLTAESERGLAEVLPGEASVVNPIDLLGSANASTYERALPVMLADPNVDAVIALFVPPVVESAEAVAGVLARAARDSAKPLLTVVMSADGVPQGGFSFPNPPRVRSGLPRAAPSGCAAPPAPCLSSTSMHGAPARSSRPQARGGSSRRLRTPCSGPTASRSWRSAGPRTRTTLLSRPLSSASRLSSRQPRRAHTRRRRAAWCSTSARRTTCAAPRSASAGRSSSSSTSPRASSCSPGWSRIRCSARSSPSAQAARWLSSSVTPASRSHR